MLKSLVALCLVLALVYCAPACSKWYQVKAGDSCWAIAHSQGSTIDKLKGDNPGVKCESLQVGERVCLNRSGGSARCHNVRKVASGDTCFKIWTQSGVGQRQFTELNANLDCNKLQVGQTVCAG